ncbi:hypothetical protein DDB_G0283991 [Dictyostelium discoideum AX4]|uniref:Uncharacterized protein n=1 Tax=Dictyostelium discoideum TaxID=44689 RepID=Q54QE2_DICDI|nr:hypothetical protein DDB_G0283991 [Dictyostelium discoideum AX4]EAL65483.1 hypothetical protein DDB_G0283991 [Dictyostelium discoideum AX4]|eukprot:XP_638802.1 hypothetical protein DDB_G0283991 [Dictyostelium discoideum AX4]
MVEIKDKEINNNNNYSKKIILAVGGVTVGSIFGYALQKGNVYLPSVIQGQMNFTNFTMLKMFMTASLTSSLAITFLKSQKLIVLEKSSTMYKRNIIGGFIMGSGISLTGACPGTVLAQIPQINGTLWTLLGGVVGATLFGFVNSYISKLLPSTQPTSKSSTTVYEKFKISMSKATIPFSIMIALVLYLIESKFPWQVDSGVSKSISIFGSISESKVWSPYVAGITIGLLQIPSFLISNTGLGCSSAYVTVGSKVCNAVSCTVDYFKSFNTTVRSIYGPLLNLGIIGGAYLASRSNPAPLIEQLNNQSTLNHFLGGFVLLFGARLNGGCTSNGLTSMGKLEFSSFVTMASMFAGGVLTSYFLNK